MKLAVSPEFVTLPAAHYLFVEKVGPFQETAAAAWSEAHQLLKRVAAENIRVGARSLFKMKPEMRYCAGFLLSKPIEREIERGSYLEWDGGRFAKFTLTGSYTDLGPAWGQVMNATKLLHLNVREGFFVENYVNDPATTAEDHLVTELMVPIA